MEAWNNVSSYHFSKYILVLINQIEPINTHRAPGVDGMATKKPRNSVP